jgi:lycopene beta-cyclase
MIPVPVDVAVLGGGPAGWSLAVACARCGLETVLLTPDPLQRWTQTYALWADRVAGLDPAVPFRSRWDRVRVFAEREHTVARPYGLIDNEALQARLVTAGDASGTLTVRAAQVSSLEHEALVSTVRVAKGRPTQARVVVDATGASSRFVERHPLVGTAAIQSAHGIVATVEDVPFADGTAVLMDWRGESREAPSFLYALDLGGSWLLEETSLARHPQLGHDELAARLDVRLRELGVNVREVHTTERVTIPMNNALPVLTQRPVAFGAAAGLVHPATGYSVAASLRSASSLAQTLASALDSGVSPAEVASQAWQVVWPRERLRARRLESYGLSRLLTMDQADTRAFFDAFFRCRDVEVRAYLDGDVSAERLAQVMWSVFRAAPLRLRQRLATGNPITLARALLRSNWATDR